MASPSPAGRPKRSSCRWATTTSWSAKATSSPTAIRSRTSARSRSASATCRRNRCRSCRCSRARGFNVCKRHLAVRQVLLCLSGQHCLEFPMHEHPIAGRAALAYQNEKFLNTPDARTLRMLAEYIEPQSRLRHQNVQDTIVFFGSARIPSGEAASSALALADEQARPAAERALELSRYYEDARELAHRLTSWSQTLPSRRRRFVITSGGGPGIMQAANLGAHEAGGPTVGFNIRLPFEQVPNPYITPELNFEFHYFFMRKFWFAYLAKALVAFPGGFGTLDEVMEILTLVQTQKLSKKIVIVLYGRSYWEQIVNFKALADWGTISPRDLDLFHFANSPQEAFEHLRGHMELHYLEQHNHREKEPEIAKTRP